MPVTDATIGAGCLSGLHLRQPGEHLPAGGGEPGGGRGGAPPPVQGRGDLLPHRAVRAAARQALREEEDGRHGAHPLRLQDHQAQVLFN